jgi:hypothetical protein
MAHRLRLPPARLRQLAVTGGVPAIPKGRSWVFDLAAVSAALKERAGYEVGGSAQRPVPLISAEELARNSMRSAESLRKLAEAGVIPSFKFGNRFLFNGDVVPALLFQRELVRFGAVAADQQEGP